MTTSGENIVVLYLEDWQKRMIKDFIGVECDRWDLPISTSPTMSAYACPNSFSPSKHKRMYLTNWQRKELRDEAGASCDFIELRRDIEPNHIYGVSSK